MTNLKHSSTVEPGLLAWVSEAIRAALARAAAALRAEPPHLPGAESALEEVAGALLLADADGIEPVTGAALRVLASWQQAGRPPRDDARAVLLQACAAIGEHVASRAGECPARPAALYPAYALLKALLGEEPVHPADLLALDRAALDAALEVPADGALVQALGECRTRFEKALLPYLKAANTEQQLAASGALRAALSPLAPLSPLWASMHAFASVAASGQIGHDLHVKQLFGQINLLLRRHAQAAAGQAQVPQALLRQALYYVGQATDPAPEVSALRQQFGIEGAPAPRAGSTGALDPQAWHSAQQALERSLASWQQLSQQLRPPARIQDDFNDALARLAAASDVLGAPRLAGMLRELGRAASQCLTRAREDAYAQEMAIAMLFVEQALAQLCELPDEFAQQASELEARLHALAEGRALPPAPDWHAQLGRELQQRHTRAVLVDEVRTGLAQCERHFEHAVAAGGSFDELAQASQCLTGVQGALSILEQHEALAAVRHVRDLCQQLAASREDAVRLQLPVIARNFAALGCFAGLLATNVEAARKRYAFDAGRGLLLDTALGAIVSNVDLAQASQPAGSVSEPLDPAIQAVFQDEARALLAQLLDLLPRLADAPLDCALLGQLGRHWQALALAASMAGQARVAATARAVGAVAVQWADEGRAANADLLALLAHANAECEAWIGELATARPSLRDGSALVEAAQRVGRGGPFEELAASAPPVEDELPPAAAPGGARSGELPVSRALRHVYLQEAEQLCAALEAGLSELHAHPRRAPEAALGQASARLAETSGTIGYASLHALADALGQVLAAAGQAMACFEPVQLELLDATLARMRMMLQVCALGELAPAQPDLVDQLAELPQRLASVQAGTAQPDEILDEQQLLERQLDQLFADAYLALVPGTGGPVQLAAAPPQVDVGQLQAQAGQLAEGSDLLQQQMGELVAALVPFSAQVDSLRSILREVEQQAQEQIASRLSISGEGAFDPLEFDRLSRLQELTRQLVAEVEAIGSTRQQLVKGVAATGAAADAQAQQARQLRDALASAQALLPKQAG